MYSIVESLHCCWQMCNDDEDVLESLLLANVQRWRKDIVEPLLLTNVQWWQKYVQYSWITSLLLANVQRWQRCSWISAVAIVQRWQRCSWISAVAIVQRWQKDLVSTVLYSLVRGYHTARRKERTRRNERATVVVPITADLGNLRRKLCCYS